MMDISNIGGAIDLNDNIISFH